ncbi:MAG: hypothetical protein COB85_02370 [Bacteroidetes bacterium]|nr:MAG: hypothetical protein COB85_02370 [Bacteroidota bacterium]
MNNMKDYKRKDGLKEYSWIHFSNQVNSLMFMLMILNFGAMAQSSEVVTFKSTTVNSDDQRSAPKEEKAIEFVIIGINSSQNMYATEELLANEQGIDRARIGAVNNHCTVISLQGYSVDEQYIKNLLKSKGLSIGQYSERWINKPYTSPGDKVYIQK